MIGFLIFAAAFAGFLFPVFLINAIRGNGSVGDTIMSCLLFGIIVLAILGAAIY